MINGDLLGTTLTPPRYTLGALADFLFSNLNNKLRRLILRRINVYELIKTFITQQYINGELLASMNRPAYSEVE